MGVPLNEADDDDDDDDNYDKNYDNYDKKEEETSSNNNNKNEVTAAAAVVVVLEEANAASSSLRIRIRSMEGEPHEAESSSKTSIPVEEIIWEARSEELTQGDERDEERGGQYSPSTLSSSTTTERATEVAAVPKTAWKESSVSEPRPPPPTPPTPRHALNEEVRKTSTGRRSSFLSSGEIFAHAPGRVHSARSMEGFLDRVRKQSGLAHDEDEDEDDSEDDRTSTEEERKQNSAPPRRVSSPTSSGRSTPKLSVEDIEICQRLDEEYERALEEREIGYNARYSSVRQSAFLSVFFMSAFLFLGTVFFMRQTEWTIADSLLFSIYTITTVGYGQTSLPTTPGFQAYTIFYILVGIAALTIMVCLIKCMSTCWISIPFILTNISLYQINAQLLIN
jgi:hypothetical protein